VGRSSQEKAQQNRALIVQTASNLFRSHGVENVSLADVMSAAGMTIGGFYKHFQSKDALVREVLDLAFTQSTASWRNVSEREHTRPDAIIKHYFTKRPPEKSCPMLAFGTYATGENPDEPALDAYRNGTEALFTCFLDHMKTSQGNPTSDDNAKILFAAMIGAKFLTQAMGDAEWLPSVRTAVRQAAAALEREEEEDLLFVNKK
jgi:TetR/AcrR family transcriptional regulator, transcriptional repressor for nem operon